MHTIKKENDKGEFFVGRMQVGSCGVHEFMPMFHGMGIVSAIKLAGSLNGGNCDFDDLYAKVLPNLWVK